MSKSQVICPVKCREGINKRSERNFSRSAEDPTTDTLWRVGDASQARTLDIMTAAELMAFLRAVSLQCHPRKQAQISQLFKIAVI